MKKITLFLTAVLALPVFAAEEVTTGTIKNETRDSSKVSKGMIIGLKKSMSEKMKAKATISGFGESSSGSGSTSDFESKLGLTLGYADINIQRAGYMVDLNYNAYEGDEGISKERSLPFFSNV